MIASIPYSPCRVIAMPIAIGYQPERQDRDGLQDAGPTCSKCSIVALNADGTDAAMVTRNATATNAPRWSAT